MESADPQQGGDAGPNPAPDQGPEEIWALPQLSRDPRPPKQQQPEAPVTSPVVQAPPAPEPAPVIQAPPAPAPVPVISAPMAPEPSPAAPQPPAPAAPEPVLPSPPEPPAPAAANGLPPPPPTAGAQPEGREEWGVGTRGRSVPHGWPRAVVATLVAVVLVGAGLTVASAHSRGRGHPLALSLASGRVYRFRAAGTFAGTLSAGTREVSTSERVTALISWRVGTVDEEGVASVEATIQPLTDRVDGHPLHQLPKIVEHLRIARDGRILSSGTPGLGSKSGAGSVFFGLDQVTPVLPPHPVEAGATWTARFEQELSDADQPLRVTAKNTLVHYETVDHRTTAVITSAVSMPFGFSLDGAKVLPKGAPGADTAKFAVSGKGSFFQTSWMDPVGGELLDSSINGRFDMTMRLTGLDPGTANPAALVPVRLTGDVRLRVEREPGPAPGAAKPSPAAAKAARAEVAKDDLRKAAGAASVYFAAYRSYQGLTAPRAADIEPLLNWSHSETARKGKISIRTADATTVLLVTKSSTGQAYCIAQSTEGTTYGRTDAKSPGVCRGGWE